jgi:hypothetical protein
MVGRLFGNEGDGVLAVANLEFFIILHISLEKFKWLLRLEKASIAASVCKKIK